MSKTFYDLVVKRGTYVNRDGEEKGNYQNIGTLVEDGDKRYLFIDPLINFAAFDRGDNDQVIVGIYPRERDQGGGGQRRQSGGGQQRQQASGGQARQQQKAAPAVDEDDIPF